jgi:hypothetical protein
MNRLTEELLKPEESYPKLDWVRVKDIKTASWNPRRASRKGLNMLSKSFEEFGNLQPIVINKRTNTLLGGHQRLKVLRRKNIKETEAWIVDQSAEDEKTIAIALNNHVADFDSKGLGSMLADLQKMQDDLDCTLFEEDEIDRIVSSSLPQLVDIEDNQDNNIINEDNIENGESTSEDTSSTNIDVSNNTYKYDLYFENAVDKLKFNAFIKSHQSKRPDVKLNGETLLVAFNVP